MDQASVQKMFQDVGTGGVDIGGLDEACASLADWMAANWATLSVRDRAALATVGGVMWRDVQERRSASVNDPLP